MTTINHHLLQAIEDAYREQIRNRFPILPAPEVAVYATQLKESLCWLIVRIISPHPKEFDEEEMIQEREERCEVMVRNYIANQIPRASKSLADALISDAKRIARW